MTNTHCLRIAVTIQLKEFQRKHTRHFRVISPVRSARWLVRGYPRRSKLRVGRRQRGRWTLLCCTHRWPPIQRRRSRSPPAPAGGKPRMSEGGDAAKWLRSQWIQQTHSGALRWSFKDFLMYLLKVLSQSSHKLKLWGLFLHPEIFLVRTW